jgi:hypothetical protein
MSGFGSGSLATGRITVDVQQDSWWGFWGQPGVYAHGKRALLVGNDDLAIIDGSDATAPMVVRTEPLFGGALSVEMAGDKALMSLGSQGAQWVDMH